MGFIEKIVWALTGLTVAGLVLVMIYWQPSPVCIGAIPVEEIAASPESDKKRFDFGVPQDSGGTQKRTTGTRGTGRKEQPKKTAEQAKLKYPVRAKKFDLKAYRVGREFRQKYGDNYREVWEAMQQAEAEFIMKPDGTKVAKIVSIQKGSIIDKLGFTVGDEIYAVNGRDFTEFEGSIPSVYKEGQKLYEQLREETEFQVEIERGGVPMVVRYQIPK